ncbi:hypothetical protein [Chenggangzhangella methanolivorans]|uniref:Uncharacterized protein n=2 Tax=Chenggangzhangella methanolivorans TaxID=1437009 RepID=A0A9E6R6C7_9HYPH|nr:hypothetical protein [Chenggangzhangella methanolivorans]QZN98629.1 hypothetical protein K6K41_16570 [Chenggangzhangella methanolivorans]
MPSGRIATGAAGKRNNPVWVRPERDEPVAAKRTILRRIPAEAAPLIVRRGSFGPSTFDADAMTVEATITAFADVQRRDARGAFVERYPRPGWTQRTLSARRSWTATGRAEAVT